MIITKQRLIKFSLLVASIGLTTVLYYEPQLIVQYLEVFVKLLSLLLGGVSQ